MSSTPTPRQQRALNTLGYLAPLLRLMRCEVARVVWTVGRDRTPRTTTMLLGRGKAIPGIERTFALASLVLVESWLKDPEDEAAVNFDTVSGLVDLHRHGEYSYRNAAIPFWTSSLILAELPRISDLLAPLFNGTLSTGGAGVLADWFDEQSMDWFTLTTILRTWSPFVRNPNDHTHGFQYTHISRDTACWQFRVRDDLTTSQPKEEWVLGLGVFGQEGLERAWHFSAPESSDPVFREEFWSLCPATPRGITDAFPT